MPNRGRKNLTRELVVDVQRRLPAGQRLVQEAFTTEHRRPVYVKVTELQPDTFYVFDYITLTTIRDAVVDLATSMGGGRLTVSYPFFGEFQAQRHRLQLLANRLDQIRVLTIGHPEAFNAGRSREFDLQNVAGTALVGLGVAMKEGARPLLFIWKESHPYPSPQNARNLGFFTFDVATIEALADDIELARRGLANRVPTFDRLQLLHQTTQQVARELESYSRRMEVAVRRAQRRPDLLTHARFNRIVNQAISKMAQLQEIPRRALRQIERSQR